MCNRSIEAKDYDGREIVIVENDTHPIKQWDVRWIDYGGTIGRHPGIIITNSGYNVSGNINTAMITSKVMNDNMQKTIIGDLIVFIRLLPLNDGQTSRIKLNTFYPVTAGQIGPYIGTVSHIEKLKSYIMACNIALITGVVPVPYEQYVTPAGGSVDASSVGNNAVVERPKTPIDNASPVQTQSVREVVKSQPKLSPMDVAKDRRVARRTDPVEVRVAINCNRFFEGDQQLMGTAMWMIDNKQLTIGEIARMYNSTTETVTRMMTDFKLAVKSGAWPQAKNEGDEFVNKLRELKYKQSNENIEDDRQQKIFETSLGLFKSDKFVKVSNGTSFYPYIKLNGFRTFTPGAVNSCFTEQEFVKLSREHHFTLNAVWTQFKKGTIRFMLDENKNLYVFKKDLATAGKNGHYTDGRRIEIAL